MRSLSYPVSLPPQEAILAEISRRKNNRAREFADETRERCQTLKGFIREAWHVLEPQTPYLENWHIDAVCEHLEAVTNRQIQHLVLNIPPGSMKSLLSSVFWPAFEWGPARKTHFSYLTASYEQSIARRDNRKMRRLVKSEWFQSLWPLRIVKNGDSFYENDEGGWRWCASVNSMTGKRANRVIFDDPHSTTSAESDVQREKTIEKFREGISDRINDPKLDSIIVMMQRLHMRDVTGVIEELDFDFDRLIIPMRFDSEIKCRTSLGWTDPRTHEGELLFPRRWGNTEVDKFEKIKGSYAFAGQYQQLPVPRTGGMFKRQWFDGKIARMAPPGTRWVRHWDLAATKKLTAARTAGVKLGKAPDGTFWVGHVVLTQDEGHEVRKLIKATAQVDGMAVEISLPQDPGQAGKVQSRDYVAMLAPFIARVERETGEKADRAEPFSVQCEAGNVFLVEGPWVEPYLDEMCQFPNGKFKDQVDATSGAFGRLARVPVFEGISGPRLHEPA